MPESRRLGVKFLFPVTFGVQDFDFSSINQGQLPDRLKQISFLPGAQIDIPVTLRWALRAAGHLGWGRELDDDDESAWIYAADIRSRFEFMHRDSTSLNLLNGFLWSGYSPNRGSRASLSRLMTGLELIHPAGRWKIGGKQVYLKSHLMNYRYLNEVEFLFTQGLLPTTLNSEWEVGAAFGTAERFGFWRLTFDRLGLAYRFGDDTSAIRLVFSSVF